MKSVADNITEGQFYIVARYLNIELLPYIVFPCISYAFGVVSCGLMYLDMHRTGLLQLVLIFMLGPPIIYGLSGNHWVKLIKS